MKIPANIIANADDLGLNEPVNKAILHCYQNKLINSTSLLTNTDHFEDTIYFIHKHPVITNIGLHVNFTEGKPVSDFTEKKFLQKNGNWNAAVITKKIKLLNANEKQAFYHEITAQLNKATTRQIKIMHIDSHYNIHVLPCFYSLFFKAAKQYKLKLRLAQACNKKFFLKWVYHNLVNNIYKSAGINYSDVFCDIHFYLKEKKMLKKNVELMLHPSFDKQENLTDHYDALALEKWIQYIDVINGK